jgi:hypothetical protein
MSSPLSSVSPSDSNDPSFSAASASSVSHNEQPFITSSFNNLKYIAKWIKLNEFREKIGIYSRPRNSRPRISASLSADLPNPWINLSLIQRIGSMAMVGFLAIGAIFSQDFRTSLKEQYLQATTGTMANVEWIEAEAKTDASIALEREARNQLVRRTQIKRQPSALSTTQVGSNSTTIRRPPSPLSIEVLSNQDEPGSLAALSLHLSTTQNNSRLSIEELNDQNEPISLDESSLHFPTAQNYFSSTTTSSFNIAQIDPSLRTNQRGSSSLLSRGLDTQDESIDLAVSPLPLPPTQNDLSPNTALDTSLETGALASMQLDMLGNRPEFLEPAPQLKFPTIQRIASAASAVLPPVALSEDIARAPASNSQKAQTPYLPSPVSSRGSSTDLSDSFEHVGARQSPHSNAESVSSGSSQGSSNDLLRSLDSFSMFTNSAGTNEETFTGLKAHILSRMNKKGVIEKDIFDKLSNQIDLFRDIEIVTKVIRIATGEKKDHLSQRALTLLCDLMDLEFLKDDFILEKLRMDESIVANWNELGNFNYELKEQIIKGILKFKNADQVATVETFHPYLHRDWFEINFIKRAINEVVAPSAPINRPLNSIVLSDFNFPPLNANSSSSSGANTLVPPLRKRIRRKSFSDKPSCNNANLQVLPERIRRNSFSQVILREISPQPTSEKAHNSQ